MSSFSTAEGWFSSTPRDLMILQRAIRRFCRLSRLSWPPRECASTFVASQSPGLNFFRYEKGLKFTGAIYIHRVSDRRFTGIAGRNFNMFRELCGESALKNVVIITNMWNEDPQDVNEAREKELRDKFFKPALGDGGAQMVRHLNTVESAHDILRRIVGNPPVVLQIQQELVVEKKALSDTAAGSAVNRELSQQIRRHLDGSKGVQEEMGRALESDEETRMELEEEKRILQEEIRRIKKDEEEMATKYAAEKQRIAARTIAMEQRAKGRRERAEAEHRRQLADLRRQLQVTTPADGYRGSSRQHDSRSDILRSRLRWND